MRIGLFGGTFDPPHKGHVAVARAAADAAGLSTVLWMPVGRQPLKSAQPEASYEQRMEMVRLVCEEDARFHLSDLDGPRADGGLNYTVDLLERLHAERPEAELWNIIGADSARDLPRWKDPARLMQLAHWIVVSRPEISRAEMEAALRFFPVGRVLPLFDVAEDVSATHIREALEHEEGVSSEISPAVRRYINQHRLYR